MATSNIIIYKTDIVPDKNMIVESIDTYLSSCTKKTYNNSQYFKIEMNTTYKINITQDYQFGLKGYNFLSVKNSDDTLTYYYFITASEWLSENTIKLTLALDTMNTYQATTSTRSTPIFTLTNNTHITREHRDRYVQKTVVTGSNTLTRIIDRETEGLDGAKFYQGTTTTVKDYNLTVAEQDSKWYFIYKTSEDITESQLNSPIECYCCADIEIPVNASSGGIHYTDYVVNTVLTVLTTDNGQFTINGYTIGPNSTYKGLLIYRDTSGFDVIAYGDVGVQAQVYNNYTGYLFTSDQLNVNLLPPDAAQFGITNYKMLIGATELYKQITFTTGTNKIVSIDSVDRNDTKLIKIIELPYPPFNATHTGNLLDVPTGFSYQNNMLKLTNKNNPDFTNTINLINISDEYYKVITKSSSTSHDLHDKGYESKLFNSEYYVKRFFYDSFEKDIFFERFDTPANYAIKYHQSNGLTSDMLFEFVISNYSELGPRTKYLSSNRNNEIAVYNNQYIAYMRNGYNYDKKQIKTNAANSAITSIATAVPAFFTGNPLGYAAGALTLARGAISTISTTLNSERQLNQKLYELQQQSSSVNVANDLDIMNYTNNNKLQYCIMKVSENYEDAVYNLFRITGYKTNKYEVPETDTRYWYNFLQCDADFSNELNSYVLPEIVRNIKDRYKTGVLIFHNNNNEYDFNMVYENYESWILE